MAAMSFLASEGSPRQDVQFVLSSVGLVSSRVLAGMLFELRLPSLPLYDS